MPRRVFSRLDSIVQNAVLRIFLMDSCQKNGHWYLSDELKMEFSLWLNFPLPPLLSTFLVKSFLSSVFPIQNKVFLLCETWAYFIKGEWYRRLNTVIPFGYIKKKHPLTSHYFKIWISLSFFGCKTRDCPRKTVITPSCLYLFYFRCLYTVYPINVHSCFQETHIL